MMPDPAFTVLVASSDRLFGEVAVEYLNQRDGWHAPPPVRDGLELLGLVARTAPQAVLVIGGLERLRPAAFAHQLTRRWPDITVVLVGNAEAQGGKVRTLPPTIDAAGVVTALQERPARNEGVAVDQERIDAIRLLKRLTPRERHTLRLVAAGQSLQDIAEATGVSEHTARTHLQNLYRKLDCHSRLDVVLFAKRHGIVRPSEWPDT
jgi:DNA-binding CsgD family transcriptional regulator